MNDYLSTSGFFLREDQGPCKTLIQVAIKVYNTACMPELGSEYAAAYDLRANIEYELFLYPGDTYKVPTGISVSILNPNYAALILPRSGLGSNKGLVLANLVGLIDPDYTGEIGITLWNRGQGVVRVDPYDRIAQMVFIPKFFAAFNVVDELGETGRGSGGFGSSGVK